jgi:aspartate-semialdehyde dehydrogenase
MSARVAVVGATGAVGQELRRLLEDRVFPLDGAPVFLASARSAGTMLPFKGGEVQVQELTADSFADVDIALFSAGGARSTEFAPIAAEAGAVVVDNSSAFRMDPDVPLVVAEVNPGDVKNRPKGIIANPNCTTMVLMVPVKPLHDAFGLTEMVATSYQAAGGAGMSGIEGLLAEARHLLQDPDRLRFDGAGAEGSIDPQQFSKVLAFNVLPHAGSFTQGRYTDEEWKLVHEPRKILGLPDLRVSPTCVRVPVLVGHSIQARLTFSSEVTREAALAAMAGFPGMRIVDGVDADGEQLAYPTPLASAGIDDVLVGRIREDLGDRHSLNIFVAGDNLLKGAALNTVQLAELVASHG